MPFSRKRGRKARKQSLCVPLHIRMQPLLDTILNTNGGIIGDTAAGGPPQNVFQCPTDPNPTQTLQTRGFVAEGVVSGRIGWYAFDWSKFADLAFYGNNVNPATASPGVPANSVFNLASFFREARVHDGWMSIERFGPRQQTAFTYSIPPGMSNPGVTFPFNIGPMPCKLHYIRLRNDEHSFMSFMNTTGPGAVASLDRFIDHPRRRTISLRQGRRIFFRFRPEVELPPRRYASSMYRNYAGSSGGPSQEQLSYQWVNMTPVSRRLGWMPARYLFPGSVNSATMGGIVDLPPTGAGISSQTIRLVSRKIAFLFEEEAYGFAHVGGEAATGPVQVIPSSTSTVFIRRAEGTKFSFRDMWIPPISDSANIGQIVRAYSWNFPIGLATDTATAEKFVPPFVNMYEDNKPLWELGAPASTYFIAPSGGARLFPIQLETNPQFNAGTFPIPQALPT